MIRWIKRRWWNWDTLQVIRPEQVTAREIDWMLRNHYIEPIRAELNKESPLLRMIENQKHSQSQG